MHLYAQMSGLQTKRWCLHFLTYVTYVGLIIHNLFTYMQKGLGTYASSGRQTCKYTYTDTAGHVKGCSMTRCEAKIDCHQQ